jgi:hypothetical protein
MQNTLVTLSFQRHQIAVPFIVSRFNGYNSVSRDRVTAPTLFYKNQNTDHIMVNKNVKPNRISRSKKNIALKIHSKIGD